MNMHCPTKTDLAALLAARSDSCAYAHRCVVYATGDVKIVDLTGFNPAGAKFWLEAWIRGNAYTGPEAAADAWWVDTLFGWLTFAWNCELTGYLDDLGLRVPSVAKPVAAPATR